MVSIIKEEETIIIIVIEVTDLIIELGVDHKMAMQTEEVIGLRIGKVMEGTLLGNSVVSKDTEIEV